MNFLPYDWVAIGYLALTGVLILIFHKNVTRWDFHLIARVLCIIGIVLLTLTDESTPFPLPFLRDWYPLSTIALFYLEIEKLTQMVFQHYFDETVIRWEKRVFKGMPSLEFSDRFPSIILSETLHLCYFSYYVIAVFLAAWLYFSGRMGPFQETVFAATLTFGTVYGRFHYVIDVLAGAVLAGIVFGITTAIF